MENIIWQTYDREVGGGMTEASKLPFLKFLQPTYLNF